MPTQQRHLLILVLFLSFGKWLPAQTWYALRLQPNGKTYTVYAKPQADWLPPLNSLLHSAKVAVVAPANGLEISQLQSHLGQWQLTATVQSPLENAGADYFQFQLTGTVQGATFLQGVETPLFSFENSRPCPGAFELVDMATDPFVLYSGMSGAIGQSFVVEGANGETFAGIYDPGQADCMAYLDCEMAYSVALLPNGYYEIRLLTGNGLLANLAVQSLKVALKVPTNFFRLHDLTNLQPGAFAFAGIMRFDAPAEEPGFDYIAINMAGVGGQPVSVSSGADLPLMRFGNAGSCQGDSIFLVKNSGDPFFPPNTQNGVVRQWVLLENETHPRPVCLVGSGAAPCAGCLFSQNNLVINQITSAGPVLCLGQTNGAVQLFAEGADSLAYSLDAGLTWQSSPLFQGLTTGTYQPVVRGSHLGCPVAAATPPVVLEEETQINLQIGVPEKACAGTDVPLQIHTPMNLPTGALYSWSGPMGFSSTLPDPVLFDVNSFRSGDYSLTLEVPGCETASAVASLAVLPLPTLPTLRSNAPVCDGEPLVLTTDVAGAKYEWIGPAGQSQATLSLPGLTTSTDTTILEKGHPAYLPGTWKIRLTDDNGCRAESPFHEVEIKKRPQAFATNNGPVCPGKNALLSAMPVPGATFRWYRAGETAAFSFDPQPLLPNVTSESTFELVVEMDGCLSENTASTTVSLHPKPSAFPVFHYTPATDCSPRDIQLTANAGGIGLTYQWTGANNFASQAPNPTIGQASAANNGSYQLQVTNVHGCTAVSPFEVTGVPDPVPTPVIQSTGAVCPGEDILLTAALYPGPQVSYRWFKNGSLLNGATSNTLPLNAVQPAAAGQYRIEVQAGGCKVESANLQVDVLPKPASNPDFVLTEPCEGATLQFLSNTNGIVAWQWTGPNGFVSQASNPVIYNTEFDHIGSYSLTVTGANGCTANASVIVDGILPVPDAPQVATNSPVCPEADILLVVQNPPLSGTVFYTWLNGLGEQVGTGTGTLQMPSADPRAVPPFLVRKTLNSCPSDFSIPIPVEIKPEPTASAANSGTVCPGDQVQLLAAPAPNANYAWRKMGDPQIISFEQNPLLTLFDTTGFELTVKTEGCDAAAIDTTTVFTHTRPAIQLLTGEGTYCEGSFVQLSGAAGAGVLGPIQYTWAGPNGFHFTGTADAADAFVVQIGALQAVGEGAYTLQLKSNEGCLSEPLSVVVDFLEMPQPPVLNVSSNLLCEGEMLQLDATAYPGNNVQYDWYFSDGGTSQSIGTTAEPTFFLNNTNPSQSGFYFVKTTVDGCEPPPSNWQQVTVLGIGTDVTATNPTTADVPVCEGGEVHLYATLLAGASYQWYGPAGFQATGNAPALTGITVNSSGNYIVEINLPGCSNTLTASTAVFVRPQPSAPVLSGPLEVCAGSDAVIAVENAVAGTTYHFYFSPNNTLIGTGMVPQITLPQVLPGQSGGYYAIAEVGGCRSEGLSGFDLRVVQKETVAAFAGEGQVVCHENETVLVSGNMPSIGTGHWRSLDGGTLLQPNQRATSVHDLRPGQNRFVWEITQAVCQYASADTTLVFLEKLIAVEDVATLSLTDTLLSVFVLGNDEIAAGAWDVRISQMPKKGSVKMDAEGVATYRPWPNVFGEDVFGYEICSMTCPEVCHNAKVLLRIENLGTPAKDCFVPNLFSPNGDGENDVFTVPCAAVFEGSQLVVFNRQGAPVYQTGHYQNDWDGSYEGGPLPTGVYFYQLSLNDPDHTVLQGFVTVLR